MKFALLLVALMATAYGQVVPEKSKLVCGACEDAIDVLQKVSNEIDLPSLIQKYSGLVCKLFPDPAKCQTDAKAASNLLSLLLMQSNLSKMLCIQAKLCDRPAAIRALELLPAYMVDSKECGLCKFVIAFAESELSRESTEEDIESALSMLCDALPLGKGPCRDAVSSYVPVIVQGIVNRVPPDSVCDRVSLCHAQSHSLVDDVVAGLATDGVRSAADCDSCKTDIDSLIAWVKANKVVDRVKAVVPEVCAVVGPLMNKSASECKSLVDSGLDIAAVLLLNPELDMLVCEKLGVCTRSAVNMALAESVEEMYHVHSENTECSLCKFVMKYVDEALENPNDERELSDILSNVCDVVPTLEGPCKALIRDYLPILLKKIPVLVTPDRVCDGIGLCPKSKMEYLWDAEEKSDALLDEAELAAVATSRIHADSLECAGCEFIFGYVDKFLVANASEKRIEAFLFKFCDFLPGEFKAECNTIVVDYYPELVQWILAKEDAKMICQHLGICAPTSLDAAALGFKPDVSKCNVCKAATGLLENVLKSKAVQSRVVDGLTDVCHILPIPKAQKPTCVQLIKTYAGEIIDIGLSFVSGSRVCNDLNLCAAS